jgi:hypothetical protein
MNRKDVLTGVRSVTHVMMFTIRLLPALLVLVHAATTQQSAAYHLPTNLKQYLTDKYQKIDDVTSSIQETPNGPQGSLHMRGKFLPKNAPAATEGDRNSRALATAKAFISEEATLLGLTNIDELRTTGPQMSKGFGGDYADIYYRRYINGLKLDNFGIHITIGPDETMYFADADLLPASRELYQATSREMLKEGKIREIVEQNLISTGIVAKNVITGRADKVAISKPPYVIWRVDALLKAGPGEWDYTIDAFTGEVLNKRDAISYMK